MFHNSHLDRAAAFSRSVGALRSEKRERNGIPSKAILH